MNARASGQAGAPGVGCSRRTGRGGPLATDRRQFTNALLRDLHALGGMLADGRIESGVRRIGAEQEMFLVDRSWRPAPVALELLDAG